MCRNTESGQWRWEERIRQIPMDWRRRGSSGTLCKAAIVRPDHYVYGVLRELSLAEEACRQLQGRLSNPPGNQRSGG